MKNGQPEQERLLRQAQEGEDGPPVDEHPTPEEALDQGALEEHTLDLTQLEPPEAGQAPPTPSPGDPLPDRLARLQAAGHAMRQGISEEIRAAANQIFEMALERAKADLEIEVRRFEDEVRHELEALHDEFRSQVAEEGLGQLDLEARLGDLAVAIGEVRDAVLGLKKRYLPGSN